MTRSTFIIVLISLLGLSACGAADVEPTRIPTRTPTPVSTPLPVVATVVPPGVPDNPLQMLIVPEAAEEAAAAETALEDALLNTTGVTVDIVLVDTYAQALAALCEAGGQSAAAWLDGISYQAAIAQNCADPVLVVQRESDGETRAGESTQLIFSATLATTQINALNGRIFCRLGYDDLHSWLIPLLIFQQSNIELDDFEQIVDYDDLDSLLAAVESGECAATGLASSVLAALTDEDGNTPFLSLDPTAPIPFGVLLYPIEVQLGARLSLTDGLIALAEAEETAPLLQPFLGQDALERFEPGQFEAFDLFIAELGLDFAQLGQ